MTVEDYVTFMDQEENIYNCVECPQNRHEEEKEYPCGRDECEILECNQSLSKEDQEILNMARYELKKETREMKAPLNYTPGCTLDQANREPVLIAVYEDPEEAMAALEKYESDVYSFSTPIGRMYEVTEYYVEDNETFDIWEFSKPSEKLKKVLEEEKG